MLEPLFSLVKTRSTINVGEKVSRRKMTVPDGILFKCPRCRTVTPSAQFEQSQKVCENCRYHSRISATERLEMTIDNFSFKEYDKDMTSKNPIKFKGYEDKIKDMQQLTDLNEAVITGECTIMGQRAVVGIMDSRFMMASMGSVVGEKITRAFENAIKEKLPVILFTASGGARMQEGIISLMQMAKTSGAVSLHNEAGLLYITVLTDPTTGGVTASFASLGDIIIAEPKVLIGFAGRRVIEATIKERLPDEFQSAEFLQQHGFVDMIVERSKMRRTLGKLLKLHK